MANDMIRWQRILGAATQVAARHVDLCLSSMPTGHRGALLRQGQRIIIYIDLAHAKSEADVIAVMAHELAHLVVGTAEHDDRWRQQMDSIQEYLRKALKEGMSHEKKKETQAKNGCTGPSDSAH